MKRTHKSGTIILLIPLLFFVGFLFILFKVDERDREQPCDYFRNYSQKNIPGRCIKYFND